MAGLCSFGLECVPFLYYYICSDTRNAFLPRKVLTRPSDGRRNLGPLLQFWVRTRTLRLRHPRPYLSFAAVPFYSKLLAPRRLGLPLCITNRRIPFTNTPYRIIHLPYSHITSGPYENEVGQLRSITGVDGNRFGVGDHCKRVFA